jgi:hypothetical protein
VTCRAALSDLEHKGFLFESTGDRYLLAFEARHLAGMRPPTKEEKATAATTPITLW